MNDVWMIYFVTRGGKVGPALRFAPAGHEPELNEWERRSWLQKIKVDERHRELPFADLIALYPFDEKFRDAADSRGAKSAPGGTGD